MFYRILAGTALVLTAIPLSAQETTPLPVQAYAAAPAPSVVLPANTAIVMTTNQEITTKGKQWNEGDTFNLSVAQDVMLGNYVVIPRGSRGVGRITWLTSKGAFGKSGKMDIGLDYVEVAGRRVDVQGTYRQEGEGNTVATVGGVVLAGVFAGFITGKSARIPQGRELTAHTKADLPVALPAGATLTPVALPAAAPVAAVPATAPAATAAPAAPAAPVASES